MQYPGSGVVDRAPALMNTWLLGGLPCCFIVSHMRFDSETQLFHAQAPTLHHSLQKHLRWSSADLIFTVLLYISRLYPCVQCKHLLLPYHNVTVLICSLQPWAGCRVPSLVCVSLSQVIEHSHLLQSGWQLRDLCHNWCACLSLNSFADPDGGITALTAYEFLLTVRDEWRLIWRRKWTGSNWLFVINHYTMLIAAICNAAPVTAQVGTSQYSHRPDVC